jgi:magnesium transporter
MTQPMLINSAAYRNGKRIGDVTLEQVPALLDDPGNFVWLGLLEPDEPLLRQIQKIFRLHELAIEDAHTAHQRPKLEAYGETLFVVLQTAQLWDEKVHFGETHVFVGKQFVVSIRHGPSLTYANVREHCESRPDRLALGPGFVLYSIIDFVVDNYLPILEQLEARLKRLEAGLFGEKFDRSCLQELYELKRQVVALSSVAAPVKEICAELVRSHENMIPKESRAYFRDISDHVKRIVEMTESIREMLNVAMQVNLALITVGQNEVVKRLAGWGAILAIPTMVFSLYGMNFEGMPELKSHYGYPLTLGFVAVACGWLFRRLRRAGWV